MDTCNCPDCPHKKQVAALMDYFETSRKYQAKLEEYNKKLETLNSAMDLEFEEVVDALKNMRR